MKRETLFNAAMLLALVAFPLWAWSADEPFLITLATKVAILALAGVGLNIALGLGGLVSLGHASFFGIGGYAMGILASHAQAYDPILTDPFVLNGTKSMPVIWLTAIVFSGLAALAIGALSLRTTGVYFIMITLAFGQMFYYFAISWPAYGGEDGLSIYLRNGFPGLNTLDPIQFYGICFAILALVLLFNARLARAPFGLALNAARQSPLRVETVGMSPYRLRLVAFGDDHGTGGRAVCRSQPLCQSRDVQLATVGRDHRFHHHRRHRTAVRPCRRCGGLCRAGTYPRRGIRLLAHLPRGSFAPDRAVRARRFDRCHCGTGDGA